MLPQEIIRHKRDGKTLDDHAIQAFVKGMTDGSIGDAQIGAFAMAVFLNGMSDAESVALTEAIRDSGNILEWTSLDLPGPVVDKHSTGGVGDLVSLILGPWVAACGSHVPMISGRGLGHTGGTLDKLEAIPGYDVRPDHDTFRRLVKEVGVAIIGQTGDLAPADKRLYGIRDVTATVESMPLIVSSILGKKLACSLDGLVMDVKVGNGAFMPTEDASRHLARMIANVATRAGTPTTSMLTDMSQPLAPAAGNALEVREALAVLTGKTVDSRLLSVTRSLAVEMLRTVGIVTDPDDATRRLDRALASGAAAERFERMVAGLGGPNDLLHNSDRHLPTAPVIRTVHLEHHGYLASVDTRALGMAVVELGGGRRQPGESIDHRVGLSELAAIGDYVDSERPLARIHARDDDSADQAIRQVRTAIRLNDTPVSAPTLIHDVHPAEVS
ncbi:thymidine phosphorylase [Aidingimonas halophila]|uniref:Thymidine phosphorylase n=1 Tax=Aidingimonas halophila TaxID=574349 RepID=A0A1H3E7W7_9GAMM|nr:thymidine phosphorylase [Aidingimonas halophila]GHC33945.1 thymidine phosphorylase [Aidingimonas halophila]SDX74796.1 thymidine phosphorylase [Aidingimonas halophila]